MRVSLVAAALSAALIVPAVSTATPTPAEAALDYLRSIQQSNGSIGGEAASAWAAIAFEHNGVDADSVAVLGGTSLEDYVVAQTNPIDPAQLGASLLALERQVLAISAMGLDPTTAAGFDAVAAIEAAFDGEQLGDPHLLNDDIFGLQALTATGVPPTDDIVRRVRTHVLLNQQPSGAFSFGSYFPPQTDAPDGIVFAAAFADVDTTGAGIVGIQVTRTSEAACTEKAVQEGPITASVEACVGSSLDPAADLAVLRGLGWTKSAQNVDGGCAWSIINNAFAAQQSNSDSTSWAIMGLRRAAQDPGSAPWTVPGGASLLSFLQSMQQPDGHFLYAAGIESFSPASTTAYAALVLSGHDFVS